MRKVVEKLKYELMAAVILLGYLIYYVPVIDELTHWCVTPYALSYRFGFISRGFMGTLVRLVFPNLTIKHIYLVILVNVVLLCVLTIFFMHKILKRAYDENKTAMVFLFGLFLINPGSVSFLFYWGNFGRFDMYLLMSLIICALLIMWDKCVWLVPALCLGAVMTHQAFVFQYFPAILVLLFYYAFIQKKKYGKTILGVTLLVTCAMFLYLQFCSGIPYTYEETMDILNLTTDLPEHYFGQDMMVRIEYYSSVFETFGVLVKEPFGRNLCKSIVMFIFLIPMIKILSDIWKHFGKSHTNIICRLLPWFVLVAEIPMFVLTCDYGRDFAAMVLCNFILIFTLYAMGDGGIKEGIKELAGKINANPMYYVFVLMLCASIGKFQAAEVGELGDRFYTLIESLLY